MRHGAQFTVLNIVLDSGGVSALSCGGDNLDSGQGSNTRGGPLSALSCAVLNPSLVAGNSPAAGDGDTPNEDNLSTIDAVVVEVNRLSCARQFPRE